jgi:hypothetical protein
MAIFIYTVNSPFVPIPADPVTGYWTGVYSAKVDSVYRFALLTNCLIHKATLCSATDVTPLYNQTRIGENRKYENIPYAYTGQKIMFSLSINLSDTLHSNILTLHYRP